MDFVEVYDFVVEKVKEFWFKEEDFYCYVNVGFFGGERKRFELF